jgi:hypothetical protein
VVETQSEARRFFIDKILDQAKTEDVKLSDDERQMLLWWSRCPTLSPILNSLSVWRRSFQRPITSPKSQGDWHAAFRGK